MKKNERSFAVPAELAQGKRALTADEIAVLERNRNSCEFPDWRNVLVSAEPDSFDPDLIRDSRFEGFVVIGSLRYALLKFYDLSLETGIVNSLLRNVSVGNDNVIRNVALLENYRLGDRVMLFNVQEMSCTNHSKFGNGILKDGEDERTRVWIGVANENDGRAVLPFETMIPADAFLWSHFRDDAELLSRFVELTESAFSKARDTFGIVENDVIIKNTTLIKDAKIGAYAYIKGAFKLKNVTILSSEEEESQIGEGVELVNGIMGAGSRVFYQAVGVRFVLGKNCQLKYGARLINSVLGDNSTVSCCELLNNLIFPFHEQHHNSSFLIATTVMGQSNIAAAATIGSNHNSRSPDGEIIAGRGFWPGLCSSFKHNSRFASFVLAAKGSYQYELDIQYPFSLVAPAGAPNSPVCIIPAWWFMYNMFAIVRNQYKFQKRDGRAQKIQHIETSPFEPDTMQEVVSAIKRIITLTCNALPALSPERAQNAGDNEALWRAAKDFLHTTDDTQFTLFDAVSQRKFGAVICKPAKAYRAYRQVVKYFTVRTLLLFCAQESVSVLEKSHIDRILQEQPLFTEWCNAGGQIIPLEKIRELFTLIKQRKICSWQQVHAWYDECRSFYLLQKVRYALYLLELLYSRPIQEFSADIFADIIEDVSSMADIMYSESVGTREKDFTDYYRTMTYRSKEEMTAVLGTFKDSDFIKTLERDTDCFKKDVRILFRALSGSPSGSAR